jgi:stage V sporulation protein G
MSDMHTIILQRCGDGAQAVLEALGRLSADDRAIIAEALAPTAEASITVLSVAPVMAGKLLGLASVELVLDDVPVTIHGIQITADQNGSAVSLPRYRAPNGEWKAAIALPQELRDAIGDLVLEAGLEAGLLKPRS